MVHRNAADGFGDAVHNQVRRVDVPCLAQPPQIHIRLHAVDLAERLGVGPAAPNEDPLDVRRQRPLEDRVPAAHRQLGGGAPSSGSGAEAAWRSSGAVLTFLLGFRAMSGSASSTPSDAVASLARTRDSEYGIVEPAGLQTGRGHRGRGPAGGRPRWARPP